MLVTETFHGYIETTQDVLLIFEGCRRGLLPRICRRLQERERKMIRSGSIFVFDERESGIKRWTDGRVWSPSRILGNFLIYRELDKKAGEKKLAALNNNNNSNERRSFSLDSTVDRNKERQLVGSLSDSYRFKEDGLIKKTMSIIVNGVAQHLISYYDPQEVLQEKLRAPSSVPELASLEISPELLVKQNFRIPPLVEPTFDQNDHHLGSITPPEASTSTGFNTTRAMHPLRSMSVGSIRHEQQQQQLMYHPYQQPHQHRPQSPSTNNFQHPLSIPNVYGNNNSNTNNTTGFHATNMPSPSSLTSSPSTPMLSPSRYHHQQHHQQQQHQRHYSTSSVSSISLPRFDPRNYSDPMRQGSSSSSLNQIMTSEQSERFASPNLGQLLNPIHPLNNTNSTNDASSTPVTASPASNDILQSMGIHQHYEYNSSNLRNSISSASNGNNHHQGSHVDIKLEMNPHTSNGSNDGNRGDNHNHSHLHRHGGGAGASSDGCTEGSSGGGGGGGGDESGIDYMYYQRPLANHQQHLHNNFMFQQQDVYTNAQDHNDLMLK
ncbi:Gti1/Pac2 family-domain-containing protein [Parasitella parasitica]|nr:Gti1/Pac2 family-domain-containing protein [Parasitella parasitica]